MSKSRRSSNQRQYGIDESELIEFIKRNPPLHDPNLQSNNKELIEKLWEEISDKLCAPVDMVKMKWLNIKESHSRRKSLRSVHNLNFLPLSSLDLSNDNSCASSNCSSPKEDGKLSMRSVSQLSTASETLCTNSTSNSATRLKQTDSRPRSRMSTPSQKSAATINKTQSKDPSTRRISSIEEIPPEVLSDSVFLSLKEDLQSDVRRLSNATSDKTQAKKQNVTDSTRAFFESMAMTVSTFPQHIQATLKVRICNLVGDAEYGLTIPKPC